LRRLKSDKSVITDLPDKTEMRALCSLTKRQAALYEKSVRELKEGLETAERIQRRGLILAFLMRLKQLCNHPAQWLGSGDYDPRVANSNVLASLYSWVQSAPEDPSIWPHYRAPKRRPQSPVSCLQEAALLSGCVPRQECEPPTNSVVLR